MHIASLQGLTTPPPPSPSFPLLLARPRARCGEWVVTAHHLYHGRLIQLAALIERVWRGVWEGAGDREVLEWERVGMGVSPFIPHCGSMWPETLYKRDNALSTKPVMHYQGTAGVTLGWTTSLLFLDLYPYMFRYQVYTSRHCGFCFNFF